MMIKSKYAIEYGEIAATADLNSVLNSYSYTGGSIDPRFENLSKTLSGLMMDRVYHSTACWSESNDVTTNNPDVAEFLHHLAGVVNFTMTKWLSLIIAMNEEKERLMANVKSMSTNRSWFNDTPQNLNADGEDLNHLTNFTKTGNETESPMTTPSQRLAEIDQSIGHYWKSWTDEIITELHLED